MTNTVCVNHNGVQCFDVDWMDFCEKCLMGLRLSLIWDCLREKIKFDLCYMHNGQKSKHYASVYKKHNSIILNHIC